eukprot:CAMPEP_0177766652 /NCGR_PEP_ID=MMETSP0491_2-20121128/8636_1 /TAXON_ID=63592 /ORGANISM="Tetraselmis chuii, Strain PLY429" /LENGTH=311 /DNA_ID=CAMNT_0019283075 /DNA_START=417 /DNA_END=1353 /DNA_ORIENTATION=+
MAGEEAAEKETAISSRAGKHAKQLAAALDAVERACCVCTDVRGSWSEKVQEGERLQKEDRTPVTVADFAVQAVVALQLRAAGCEEPLVAEEDSAELRAHAKDDSNGSDGLLRSILTAAARNSSSEQLSLEQVLAAIDVGCHDGSAARHWILDPIDGTVGFMKGGACQYTVGLGYVEAGEVVVGAMGLPNWSLPIRSAADGRPPRLRDPPGGGIILYAAKGGGSWVRPLRGSPDGSDDFRVEVAGKDAPPFPSATNAESQTRLSLVRNPVSGLPWENTVALFGKLSQTRLTTCFDSFDFSRGCGARKRGAAV